MDELISRRDTISAMENVDWYHISKDGRLVHGANSDDHEPLYKAKDVYAVLNTMPSAQPEIVRCKDCTFYRSDGCFFSTAEIEEDGFCSWAERKTDE